MLQLRNRLSNPFGYGGPYTEHAGDSGGGSRGGGSLFTTTSQCCHHEGQLLVAVGGMVGLIP